MNWHVPVGPLNSGSADALTRALAELNQQKQRIEQLEQQVAQVVPDMQAFNRDRFPACITTVSTDGSCAWYRQSFTTLGARTTDPIGLQGYTSYNPAYAVGTTITASNLPLEVELRKRTVIPGVGSQGQRGNAYEFDFMSGSGTSGSLVSLGQINSISLKYITEQAFYSTPVATLLFASAGTYVFHVYVIVNVQPVTNDPNNPDQFWSIMGVFRDVSSPALAPPQTRFFPNSFTDSSGGVFAPLAVGNRTPRATFQLLGVPVVVTGSIAVTAPFTMNFFLGKNSVTFGTASVVGGLTVWGAKIA